MLKLTNVYYIISCAYRNIHTQINDFAACSVCSDQLNWTVDF